MCCSHRMSLVESARKAPCMTDTRERDIREGLLTKARCQRVALLQDSMQQRQLEHQRHLHVYQAVRCQELNSLTTTLRISLRNRSSPKSQTCCMHATLKERNSIVPIGHLDDMRDIRGYFMQLRDTCLHSEDIDSPSSWACFSVSPGIVR